MENEKENIVPNGGFENLELSGRPAGGWAVMRNEECWTNGQASVIDRTFEGAHALRIEHTGGASKYLRVFIREGFKPGAIYTLSARINYMLAADAQLRVYAEYYRGNQPDDPATVISQEGIFHIKGQNTNDQFNLESGTFTVPADATLIVLGFVLAGSSGMMILDDVRAWCSGAPEPYTLLTDQVFYHPDDTHASAYVSIDPYYRPGDAPYRATATFQVKDGERILRETTLPFADSGEARFTYPLSLLTEKEHRYTVEIAVKDGIGETLQSATQEAYIYDRPTVLGTDGLLRYPGEEGIFHPIIAYWPLSDTAKMKEIGINVVQINGAGEGYKAKLDHLHALGMKGLVCLYVGGPEFMRPPTTPKNIEWAKKALAEIADHPAVFAWNVQDEPLGGRGRDPEQIGYLIESYKLIRQYDKTKPIYLLDYNAKMYSETQKYADQFIVDLYTTGNTAGITLGMGHAQNAVVGRKPIYYIGMTYKPPFGPFPSEVDVRGGVYRAFEEGAKGIGWYTMRLAYGQYPGQPKIDLPETELWAPMKEMYENEWPHLFRHYAEGAYKTVCVQHPTDPGALYYEGWQERDDVYMVVHNRGKEDMTAEISLPQNSLHICAVVGGHPDSVMLQAGVLTVQLKAQEPCLLRLSEKYG